MLVGFESMLLKKVSPQWDSGCIARIRVIMDMLETPDKDLPLRDDIRLLGRILGDTVRSQEGEPVFAIVERIRRTSIRFHRDEDEAARQMFEAYTKLYGRIAKDFDGKKEETGALAKILDHKS